jgi:hypothetical protein
MGYNVRRTVLSCRVGILFELVCISLLASLGTKTTKNCCTVWYSCLSSVFRERRTENDTTFHFFQHSDSVVKNGDPAPRGRPAPSPQSCVLIFMKNNEYDVPDYRRVGLVAVAVSVGGGAAANIIFSIRCQQRCV